MSGGSFLNESNLFFSFSFLFEKDVLASRHDGDGAS